MSLRLVLAALLFWVGVGPSTATAAQKRIVLASTTSTQNSGLYDYLLPIFTKETGYPVHVVAVGTGQALRIARNGDADVLIVHHRPSEDAFVAAGDGKDRRDVMYNDFVIVGPAGDPAGVAQSKNAAQAFVRIYNTGSTFISRGDESGTHLKEQSIWRTTGIKPQGKWFREIGAGMGAALNMASAVDAYLLTDRGTWLSFNNRGNLTILLDGDPVLNNPYGIITVSPIKHPYVNLAGAQALTEWITSAHGQKLIADFSLDGQQLFCPTSVVISSARCPSATSQ